MKTEKCGMRRCMQVVAIAADRLGMCTHHGVVATPWAWVYAGGRHCSRSLGHVHSPWRRRHAMGVGVCRVLIVFLYIRNGSYLMLQNRSRRRGFIPRRRRSFGK